MIPATDLAAVIAEMQRSVPRFRREMRRLVIHCARIVYRWQHQQHEDRVHRHYRMARYRPRWRAECPREGMARGRGPIPMQR